ncbi:MAG: IS1182 family transposase [Terriglobales bacterium]
MSKTYRPWNPNQDWLLPPSPRQWLPEGDLVYFMLDIVETLDLSAVRRHYEQEARGFPPFHPRMMVTLLLYAYGMGVYSSRRMEKLCERDAAFRVIVGEDVPNFRTISDFRKIHLAGLQELFTQVLKLCRAAGLLRVGLVSLDGSKVKANASRHKAMSYEYMQKDEQRLQQEISELLAKAESADASEDELYGRDVRGDELPAELARRESRLAKIQEAKQALEEQARAAAQAEEARRAAEDEQRRGAGETPRARKPVDPTPDPKAQRNFTDPESKIMKVSNKGFDQCGNAQIVVNEEQIILAADVTHQANDKQQVEPMVAEAQQNLAAAGVEEQIGALDADCGYYSEDNVSYLEGENIDAYIATERLKHHEQVVCASEGPVPEGLTPKERMARKLRTQRGRATYAKRKGMVEPVFGQIKQARGFRQFLLRGLEKMRGEWRLICMTHNLRKLFGSARWAPA